MGSDCCSGGGENQDAAAAPTAALHHDHDKDHQAGHNHDHGHEPCGDDERCIQEGECCDDDSCCNGDPSGSATLVCCDSNDEQCDEKCIIAAAALECEKTCETDGRSLNGTWPKINTPTSRRYVDFFDSPKGASSHKHQHDEDDHHPSTACSSHLAKAFDQYSAYLVSAQCICRSILERGWSTTCCGEQPKNVAAPAPDLTPKDTIDEKTGAYATGRDRHHHDGPHHHHRNRRHGRKVGRQLDGCCKSEKDDCCSGDRVENVLENNQKSSGSRLPGWDVEKAAAHEHIALAVDGMTCSGCGNKMERTLKAIPGVSSVRVNFVMGHAEFSVDTIVNTADEVIRAAERATNFRCNRMASDDQVLDLLASGPSARALLDFSIPGITGANLLNKKTVRLSYDPTIIGARMLLDKVGDLNTGLAPHQDDPSVSSGRKRLYDQLIKTILAAVFTLPVVVMAWGDNLVAEKTRAIVSVVLATVVQLIAVPDFYRPAIGALFHSGTIEMDMLVVISITAAYVYSVVAFGLRMAGKPLETPEFFETSTLLITLVILGRLVAAFARIRAVEAVSLRSLQSTMAVVVEDGKDKEIDARLLQYGDKLKIGPHSAVATDGTVISGSSEIDESMLTGESVPVFKTEGDAVVAGTINGTGTLVAKLTRLPGKNTVTDIAKLVEAAQNSKPKLQDYADRVAGWFVPMVTTVAVIVVIVWLVVGFKVRNYDTGESISNAITYAVASLAVACPCALGLAVPMVLVIAGGIAARNGVIIKSAECTERARKVTDVVFDKTGTITEESLDVMEHKFLIDEEEAIAISKAMVVGNKHPVSLAVAKYLERRAAPAASLSAVHVIAGAGVEAKLNEADLRAGSPKWTGTDSHAVVSSLQDGGMTLLIVTRDAEPIAVYGLRTRLRAEAARVVAELNRRKITVHLVSGDQKRAVEMVASQVGIPNVASQCSPAEKRDYVANLMSNGKNIMFVGDGTNDAVAVTQADVGVQLSSVLSASDVTRGAADVILLNGLEGIPFIMDISGVSFRRMVFNFVWSAVYNVVAILLASGAFVNVRIPPAYAGLGEIVSVVPVILAALTMLLKKTKATSTTA